MDKASDVCWQSDIHGRAADGKPSCVSGIDSVVYLPCTGYNGRRVYDGYAWLSRLLQSNWAVRAQDKEIIMATMLSLPRADPNDMGHGIGRLLGNFLQTKIQQDRQAQESQWFNQDVQNYRLYEKGHKLHLSEPKKFPDAIWPEFKSQKMQQGIASVFAENMSPVSQANIAASEARTESEEFDLAQKQRIASGKLTQYEQEQRGLQQKLLEAQIDSAGQGPKQTVQDKLHDYAISQGHAAGTPDYSRITKGALTKEEKVRLDAAERRAEAGEKRAVDMNRRENQKYELDAARERRLVGTATVAETRAVAEEQRKVNAELRAKEKHEEKYVDEIDPVTGRRISRNKRTNETKAVGAPFLQEDRKLSDQGLARLTSGDDIARTIDDLIFMMQPGGAGTKNVGLFDNAMRRIKTATGTLSGADQVWKQKFTELQLMINKLNKDQRLADSDYERLKTALPLEILNDAAFKTALYGLKDTNDASRRQIAQDYIDVGYRIPQRFHPKFDAANATNEQKAAELRRRGFKEAQVQEAIGNSGGGQ